MLSKDLGPYRIEGLLGSGGMGEVYRAYDRRLDRRVAVKVVRPDASSDLRTRERFRREARAAARLSHPSIVQIHDIIEREEEGDCIVMELVEGENLSEILARGPLDREVAVRLARQIAEGLAVAHVQGIVHRDLKSENIRIATDGRPKILDFGLAKHLRRAPTDHTLSIDGRVVGTGHAMSPEQAQGLQVDPRSDLFALGTLLYEMLTGTSPFRRPTLAETLTWVCVRSQEPVRDLAPEVPEELSRLVDRLLAKDPEDRPGSAEEVALALRVFEPSVSASVSASQGASQRGSQSVGRGGDSGAGGDSADQATLVDLPRIRPPGSTATGSTGGEGSGNASRDASGDASGDVSRRLPGLTRVALVGLLLLAGVALGWRWLQPEPLPLVLVAVPEPTVAPAPAAQDPALLAASVRVALLQGLLGLEGVAPLAPDQVDAVPGSSESLARALAADEVITARLACSQLNCRATLHRVGADGQLHDTESCDIPVDDLLLASDTLAERAQRLYGEERVRAGVPRMDIAEDDYEAFLRLRTEFRSRTGSLSLDDMLERCREIRQRSPRFLPVYSLEADLARSRFASSREAADLERALDVLQQARELDPEASPPLVALVNLGLESDRLDLAESAMEELERVMPGDPRTLSRRAEVLERRGRVEEALELLRTAVRRRPSVDNLFNLANMEIRRGHPEEAQGHLEALLELHSDNFGALSLLAQNELIYGDAERAAELYRDLVARAPDYGLYANLGVAELLLERYGEASESFRQALELAPRSPLARFNLADALLLEGRAEEAQEHYRQVREGIDTDPAGNWLYPIVKAQALAHLGEDRRAASLAQQALQDLPDNSQVAYGAAVVFAVVGDTASALASVERTLELGFDPRWFEFFWFDPLRSHPDFQALFEEPPSQEAPSQEAPSQEALAQEPGLSFHPVRDSPPRSAAGGPPRLRPLHLRLRPGVEDRGVPGEAAPRCAVPG